MGAMALNFEMKSERNKSIHKHAREQRLLAHEPEHQVRVWANGAPSAVPLEFRNSSIPELVQAPSGTLT